jgi:hypothetical protein
LLIFEDAGGLSARRWAAEVDLNGKRFDEAPLIPGDRLSVGPAVLEVLSVDPLPTVDLAPAVATLENAERQLAAALHETGHTENNQAVASKSAAMAPSARSEAPRAGGGRGAAPDSANGRRVERPRRTRRRKLRAEVRRNRHECRKLAKRIGDLECLLHSALAVWDAEQVFAEHERSPVPDQPDPPRQSEPARTGEYTSPGASTAWPTATPFDEVAAFAEFSIFTQGADESVAPSANSAVQDAVQSASAGEPSEWSAPAAQGTSATPAADTPVEQPSDHRQEFKSDSDTEHDSLSTAPPAVNATTPPSTATFIDRYSHLFAEARSSQETPSSASAQPSVPESALQSTPPASVAGAAAEQQPTDDDEETIEQYMARLLERVRGGAAHTAEPTTSASWDRQRTAGDVDTRGREPAAQSPATEGDSQAVTADEERVTTSLGTTRKKAKVVEEPANLEAFRAVANASARRAIGTHAQRVHRRNALTKAIVATLAGMTSLWLMLEAPDLRDVQFITACVSSIAAAYWVGQTYGTLVEAFRAASYAGPEKPEKHSVAAGDPPARVDDPFRPSLPIDVK